MSKSKTDGETTTMYIGIPCTTDEADLINDHMRENGYIKGRYIKDATLEKIDRDKAQARIVRASLAKGEKDD